jgi:uncharacterized membrane protein
MKATREQSVCWAILTIIVIAAGVLRFAVIDHSLWFDEQASAFFSDQPFARLWSDWMLRETNPPLYYSFLRVWRSIVGSSDGAIRAPSVIASLCALGLIFALTRRLYGQTAGLIAAGLVALSGQHLYFAEQARSYIFVLCAALIATGALVTLSASEGTRLAQRRALIVYACAVTVAIYLHTTMILFPAFAFAAVIAANPTRYRAQPKLLLPFLYANFTILIASAWAIRMALLQIIYRSDNIAAIGLVDPRRVVEHTLLTLFFVGGSGVLSYVVAVPLLLLTIRFVVTDRHNEHSRLLAGLAGNSLLVLAGLGMFVPVFVPRTIFWMAGIVAVLSAAALARVRPPLRRVVLPVTAIALAIDTFAMLPKLEEEDWNSPVRIVAAHPGASMLVQGESMAVLADSVCRRQRSAPCPYAIVAVTVPHDPYDSWGSGLFAGPKIPIVDLPTYAAGRTIFLFRKRYYHNLPDLLHARGLGSGISSNGPPLLGPLPASALEPASRTRTLR